MVDLVKQYNAIFQAKPSKWSSPGRDEFAFNAIEKYGEPANLLDIGCGNGHTLKLFGDKWKGTRLYGIDLSDEAIRLAKENVPQAEFACAFFEDYKGYAPEMFERITLLGVIEHFPTTSKALAKIRSLLKPGGYVYIEAPNCLQASRDPEESFRVLKNGSGQWEWHLRRQTWEQKIAEAGFKITQSLRGPTAVTEFVWVLNI